MEITATGWTASGQLPVAEERAKSLTARSAEAQSALERLTDEPPRREAKLWAAMSVVKESLRAEKTRVERLKRQLATEIVKEQQLLT